MLRYSIKLGILCFLSLIISVNAFAMQYKNEEKNIDAFVQKFAQAYEKRDLNTLMEYYTPNAIVIGTGNDEILKGKNEIMEDFKRDFLQSTNANIEVNRIAVDVKNNIAFISYLLKVNVIIPNQKPFQSQLRFSAGLIKDKQRWLIVQSHLSAPLAEQKAGRSFPDV